MIRTLRHATLVRGDEGVDASRAERREVAAGIRQPLSAYVDANPDLRLIDERFMQIQQAVGTTLTRTPAIEELEASGFVADSLTRSGQTADLVAP